MQVEHRTTVNAPPDVIFRIYEDVGNWHTWDPDTKQATLDGPFRVGSRGTLTPTRGRTVPMLLTEVVPAARFTAESRIPLFLMGFEHELKPVGVATEVTHRVTLSGAVRLVIGRMLVGQMNAGLPVTLARLKALAEARHATV